MKNINAILFVLVSMFVAMVELTFDPTFYVGRIFLGISVVSMFTYAIMFVSQYWRLEPQKISRK